MGQSIGLRRELFRHAKVEAPRILDLGKRLQGVPKLRRLLNEGTSGRDVRKERRKWAKDHLASKAHVRSLRDLDLASLRELELDAPPADRLPGREAVRDAQAFATALAGEDAQIEASKRALSTSLFAAMVDGDATEIDRLSRSLQIVEALPGLATVEIRQNYAPVVLTRSVPGRVASQDGQEGAELIVRAPESEAPRQILLAWDLANEYAVWAKRQLDARAAALKSKRFGFEPPKLSARLKETTRKSREKEARRAQYSAYIEQRRTERRAIAKAREDLKSDSANERLDKMSRDKAFAEAMMAAHGIDVPARLDEADRIKGKSHRGFCAAYKAAVREEEEGRRPTSNGCNPSIDNPCVAAFAGDWRRILGSDDIRLLGIAQLITVDEEFMGYTPGEISAVESVLKGEFRERTTKTARYFEEISQDTTTTTEEKEAETTTTTEQELSNQIEQELSTRFSSDINAEASGEAGGTIGVVNFAGAASLGSNVGVGVDSSLSQSSADSFSQEIVARALERTKAVTTKLRRQRSYRLYETTILNRLDNTDGGSSNYNAVFCYLDKEVCIKERVYGLRQFMGAEVMRPGMELLKQELRRHAVDLAELGKLPDFDLTPAMVTPENYMSLVGKFRAANVMPPPPVLRMDSRTYKSDTASEARMPEKGMVEKMADTLAPFFGDYKRYLIQDQIEVPEGYRIQQVDITVSHGQNGVSIPAHLPFSVLGAAIFAGPTLGISAIPPYTFFYLPVAVWQMLYTAAPLMHVHADSSHVTTTVGHEAHESRYFFFDPEELLRDMLEALEASTVLDTGVLQNIQGHLQTLYGALGDPNDENALLSILNGLSTDVTDYFTNLHAFLGQVLAYIPNYLAGLSNGNGPPAAPDPANLPTIDPSALADVPSAIMAPFQTFFEAVMSELGNLMDDILGDLFAFLEAETQNIDGHTFGQVSGLVGSVPISFNVVALKPGVAVNLTACMVRIDEEALDMWRLETFERLSQAHAQLEAEFAAKAASRVERPAMRGNPPVMRADERASLKARLMNRLHLKYSATPDQPTTLDEARLFEHVFDWTNLTYRLFNFGPEGFQVAHEALGLYATADLKRRAFLDAGWAKVMLPLQDDTRLEQVFIDYMKTGVVNFEADLLAQIGEGDEAFDELTAIYRDLVLRRNQELGTVVSAHTEKIPTEFIVIHEGTPDDPYPSSDVVCSLEVPDAP